MRLSLSNLCLGMTFFYDVEVKYPDSEEPIKLKKKFLIANKNYLAEEFLKHAQLLSNSKVKLGETKSKKYFEALVEGRFGDFTKLEVHYFL